jgi:proteasome lid subunit RPN8/RPN11
MATSIFPRLNEACWSAPGHSFTIDYPIGLLDAIRAEAVDGLYRLRHGGIEIGGVLFGSRTETGVRILKYRPLQTEYAQGPFFLLSEKDESSLEEMLKTTETDPELSGLVPVGWYHSHTRTGVSLSEQDLALYNRRFPEPWQIALVLRPTHLGPAEVGFFFREANGVVHCESSHNAFTMNPRTVPQAAAPPRLEVARTPIRAPVAAEPEKPKKGSWMWLATAIVLAGLGLAVLTDAIHISGLTGSHSTLNLRATDSDGAVRIEWDPTAEPLVEAGSASLLVLDGDQRLETPLSREMLQTGKLDYRRHSPDVEIRLRVNGPGANPVQELTRLTGLPAVPTPAPERYAADRSKALKPAWTPTKKRTVAKSRRPVKAETEPAPQALVDPPRRSGLQRARRLLPPQLWRRSPKPDEVTTDQ